MRVAVVGAGWAGMAAAVQATQDGHHVSVFEAARVVGGRARALTATLPDGKPVVLDNGQHILIGAYTQSLHLMRTVGVEPEHTLTRLPLTLQFPDGDGLTLPPWPSPLDALAGILRTPGWRWADKWALLCAAARWQGNGFACAPHTSVADLCNTLPSVVMHTLIEPLCVSALNTPAHRASGQVFLTVLRDALLGGRGSSNLLLPRTDLGRLFPQAAADWLQAHGAAVHLGTRVDDLRALPQGRWQLDQQPFDAVVWATAASNAAQVLAESALRAPEAIANQLHHWANLADRLAFESIATVYAHSPQAQLALPMLALRNDARHPAQFVFDRAQLGGPSGLLAFVVSASDGDRKILQDQVLAQARAQLGLTLTPVQTVVEKRATFACTPGLRRPTSAIAPGLWACGDYVEGPYPATLEGAVRSGLAAAQALRH